MKIHLLSAYPLAPINPSNFSAIWLRESAAMDPFGKHQVTDDPAEADVILFVEFHPPEDPYLLEVFRHPLYRRYRDKSFLYQDADVALPLIRGIYPSIKREDYQPDRCRSAGYIARISDNHAIRYDPAITEKKWLYSFFGEANSPVRKTLFSRTHPQGLVRDTTGTRLWKMEPGPDRNAFTQEYAEAIRDSKFVLCPAGLGPLTYRLFETMEMGRVPVILSDQWVAPQGPRWEEFCLILPEASAVDLETILESQASCHEEMGRKAREAWEQWFAKPVCFHRLAELCLELKECRPKPLSTLRAWSGFLRPMHIENWLRPHLQPLKHRALSMVGRSNPVGT